MKKPKLKKVEPSTVYRDCEKIQAFCFAGTMQDYRTAAQSLINRFIPDGWRLDFDDTDSDAFDGRTNHIFRTFNAADELLTCYVSCDSLHLAEKIKRIVVGYFTTWLSHQFDQFGEEAK